jgi:lysophospholipase L1-like esterase
MSCASSEKRLPQIVLFGDSLTQWSFNDRTQGFGWYLSNLYRDKVEIVNEGTDPALQII